MNLVRDRYRLKGLDSAALGAALSGVNYFVNTSDLSSGDSEGNQMNVSARCSDCKTALPEDWARDPIDHACPTCGSIRMDVRLTCADEVGTEVHGNMRAKVKDPNRSSKQNQRVDVFAGEDLRKSDGTWMKKERIIDRDNDRYKETVVDPGTGEVVHQNEEPLSEHYGHGSDKARKPGAA